jgi:hypothetical protein
MQDIDLTWNPETFNNEKFRFTSKLNLYLRNKLEKWYIWDIAVYSAENETTSESR